MNFIDYLLGGGLGTAEDELGDLLAERSRAMQDAARTMGGFGGAMLMRLAVPPPYRVRQNPDLTLKEGLMDLNVKFTRIDKEHVLIEVACIKRVVHSKKELQKLASELIAKHAEQYLWAPEGSLPKRISTDTLEVKER